MCSSVVAYGVKISQKKIFDSTAITTSLYCPAYPKYLAETILPPPTLCECRECAEDAPRSVQMHTGASSAYVPTLSRPCLCFWTLPYSVVFSIIAWFFYLSSILSTYSNPQDRSRTDLGSQPHVCSLFSFVFRGDKSRPTADCQSSTRGRGQEDYQALSYLQFHSLTWKNKSQEKNNGGQPRLPPLSLHRFCFREPLRKTLTAFFTVTFRIFRGHRCILNLPCILRTGVVHFRSPSHQPSTSHHCVQCRWLGESRPST